MSTRHIIPERRWPLLGVVFICAVCFSFCVLSFIRRFHIPSSDVTSIGLSFGLPLSAFFFVLQRGFFPGFSSFGRLSLSSLFALILAAAAFWIGFIGAWGLFGGTAP